MRSKRIKLGVSLPLPRGGALSQRVSLSTRRAPASQGRCAIATSLALRAPRPRFPGAVRYRKESRSPRASGNMGTGGFPFRHMGCAPVQNAPRRSAKVLSPYRRTSTDASRTCADAPHACGSSTSVSDSMMRVHM